MWILLTLPGHFGIHRFYPGKRGTGRLRVLTVGLFGIGWLYDYWTPGCVGDWSEATDFSCARFSR